MKIQMGESMFLSAPIDTVVGLFEKSIDNDGVVEDTIKEYIENIMKDDEVE